MSTFTPTLIGGQPATTLMDVPVLDTFNPVRFNPRVRTGYFYLGDRQYYLYDNKGSCHLADVTWYEFDLSDEPVKNTETVWVRGIDITGSNQYRFVGNKIQVNGGALTHPGTLVDEVNYDITLLDPMDLGGVIEPSDSVKIEYEFLDWSASSTAFLNINDSGATVAGFNLTSTINGKAGDSIIININNSGGAGSTATITSSGTDNPNEYDLDWFDSTTVETVVTALQGSGLPWDAVDDGNGIPSTDLFSALLTGAAVSTPSAEAFSGGSTQGYSLSNITETLIIDDAQVFYELPKYPANHAPVIITDDLMFHWDRRDISPEFKVFDDRTFEFNVPKNEITNPDFSFSNNLDYWMTSGSPTTAKESSSSLFSYPRARSSIRFARIPSADSIAQVVPAFDEQEHFLSMALRDHNGGGVDITVTFYDESWNSLASYQDTINNTSHPEITNDWIIADVSFGPPNQTRVYDHDTVQDSTWALIEFESNSDSLDLDYVFWGRTKLQPDHWQPNPLATVEYEVGEDSYYDHNPLIVYDHYGNPRANLNPLETCNLHGVTNTENIGFVYIHEYDARTDFQLGLGGIRLPVKTNILLGEWPEPTASDEIHSIVSINNGFYVSGDITNIENHTTDIAKIKEDGTVDTDFTVSLNGDAYLAFDETKNILYLVGTFTTVNGTSRNRAAAVNPNTGELLDWDPDLNNDATSIALLKTGVLTTIFVGGSFTDVNSGTTRNNLASFDEEGTATSFNPNPGDVPNSLLVDRDAGKLYAAFDDIMRWDIASGSADSFNPTTNSEVFSMDLLDGVLYVGGDFTTVNTTVSRNNAAAFSTETGDAEDWDPDPDGTVNTLVIADSWIYLGGDFNNIGSVERNLAGQVDTDGELGKWDPDFSTGASDTINTIAVFEGVVAIGGLFDSSIGEDVDSLAFYPHYNSDPVMGRRYLPYAKVDGLGKLKHVNLLQYNSDPWIKEVTNTDEVPTGTTLELIPSLGQVTQFIDTYTTTSIINKGETSIDVDSAFVNNSNEGDLVRINGYWYEIESIDSTNNSITIDRGLVEKAPISSDVELEGRAIKGYVGQQRIIRVKLRDQWGAPLGQKPILAVSDNPEVALVIDEGLPTNQDGEWYCTVEMLSSGSANLYLTGSGSLTIPIISDALPNTDVIEDNPAGPEECDTNIFSTLETGW